MSVDALVELSPYDLSTVVNPQRWDDLQLHPSVQQIVELAEMVLNKTEQFIVSQAELESCRGALLAAKRELAIRAATEEREDADDA